MSLDGLDERFGRAKIAMRYRLRAASDQLFAIAAIVAFAQGLSVTAQAPPGKQTEEEATSKRLHGKGWWPTATYAKREAFVGTEACRACHSDKVFQQQRTSMAKAAWKAAETAVLQSNSSISHSIPPFQTEIAKDREGNTYTVKRGGEEMTGRILWSMGNDTMGQTFVLRSNGNLFESELSYFASIRGLDLTPGHSKPSPENLEQAFGERQSAEDAQKCFACHTTASSVRGQFDPERAIPGITCEACHGPGALHVKAMQDKQIEEGRNAIVDPGSFDPVKLVDFCGACHRAPLDVAAMKAYVPINIRFQPYRLSKSRCWSKPDRRISCIACHNPHDEVVRDITYYDSKCLACHAERLTPTSPREQGSAAPGTLPSCKVSTSHCVSCHMPKYVVPQMHGSFTDHDIRIVHAGDPLPL